MPRIIPILALALLLVVGCGERISPEKYKEISARADTIVANHERLEATLRGILGLIPCPPCPDTVIYLIRAISDDGREAIVWYPIKEFVLQSDTVIQMPPGRWVSVKVSDLWPMYCVDPHIGKGIDDNVYLIVLPDSVRIDSAFILKGE
ncbi:MAG: hypothetical protein WBC98_11295 [Candidatus Zixiibacteriota bacterium]